MNENLSKIKDEIIKEFGDLSYSEKKYLKNSFNKDFVERELLSLQKQKKQIDKIVIILASVTVIFLIFVLYILFFDESFKKASGLVSLLIVSMINSALQFISKNKLEKKLSLYRILSALDAGI